MGHTVSQRLLRWFIFTFIHDWRKGILLMLIGCLCLSMALFQSNIADVWIRTNLDTEFQANTAKIHFIYSVQATKYQEWQSRYNYFWFQKSQQAGSYTRLLSASKPDHLMDEIPTFVTNSYQYENGDIYLPYNKPNSILSWINSAEANKTDFVVILDPDCVILKPFVIPDKRSSDFVWVDIPGGPYKVTEGFPLSHVSYMEANAPPFISLAKKFCAECRSYDSLAVPTVIHRNDLKKIAPGWLSITEEIRRHKHEWLEEWNANNFGLDWTTEMYGYVFAAAKLGISHQVVRTAQDIVGYNRELKAPILHYSLKVYVDKEHFWQKHSVDAAYNVLNVDDSTDEVSKRFLSELKDARDSLPPTGHDYQGLGYFQPQF